MTEETTAPAEQETIEQPQEAPQEVTEDSGKSIDDAIDAALADFDKEETDTADDEGGEESGEDRPRNPDGTFAKKKADDDEGESEKAEEADTDEDKAAEDKPAEKSGIDEPPSRFSADAKKAWEKAPPEVRGEIHRAISEMEKGLGEKDAILDPLKPYIQRAEKEGVDFAKTVEGLVQWEDAFRRDPAAAFRGIASNLGWTPEQAAAAIAGQQQGQVDPRDREIMELKQQVQQLSQGYGSIQETMQQTQHQAIVKDLEAFAEQHEHFDALAPDIANILKEDQSATLEDAYDRALKRAQELAGRFNPAPPEPTQAPPASQPAQTRPAKSITGTPSGGSTPSRKRPVSTDEAIESALNSLNI